MESRTSTAGSRRTGGTPSAPADAARSACAFEADVASGGIGADALQERAQRRAAPLADHAPPLDADMARDLADLRQCIELIDHPWPLVVPHGENLIDLLVAYYRLPEDRKPPKDARSDRPQKFLQTKDIPLI